MHTHTAFFMRKGADCPDRRHWRNDYPDGVNPALRRPGRFDREFFFPLPDLEVREEILGTMAKGMGGVGC